MAYRKYVTFSFDDGVEQDKEIIRIMRSCGLRGCTFNLNTGLMGQRHVMGRIGDIGMLDKTDLNLLNRHSRIVHYSEYYRIPSDEIAQVYDGFEVASHAEKHQNLKKISGEELEAAIGDDVKRLRELTGQPVIGFAYPYGAVSDEAITVLKKYGIRYARMTNPENKNYSLPEDPYRLMPNRYFIQKDIVEEVKRYLNTEPTEQDQMLYLWGHGYEFDFGTQQCNWDKLKRVCDLIASDDRVMCVTNQEALGFA